MAITTELADLAGEFCFLALRVVTRTPRAAGMIATDYKIYIYQSRCLDHTHIVYYLVVSETRVLEGVNVGQVGGFRGELNTRTLNKERVVVSDDSPDQFGTHFL